MSPPRDTILRKNDSVLVKWLGKSEPAVVRKLRGSGKVKVLWLDGTVSVVDREDVTAVASETHATKKDPMELFIGDSVLVKRMGELQLASISKFHRDGRIRLLWFDGNISSVERADVQLRSLDLQHHEDGCRPLCKGDSVMVRWHGELHSAIVRKLHKWKVQVLWEDGTVSCVSRHEVHDTTAARVRKRKLHAQTNALTCLGRPLKKDRYIAQLTTPPRFAPPLCWCVLGPMDQRGVVSLPQFFNSLETNLVIESIESAVADLSLVPVSDRADTLQFNHTAYRIDQPFWENAALVDKVVGAMRWADDQVWNSLSWSEKQMYLEPEFIRYHGSAASKSPYAIEPHVDNHSALTFVCLLSRPEDFQGGSLGFKAATPQDKPRFVQMALGDAVVFRGEKLLHWVTPVTSGKREVLQVELSRI